jgi:hypothetical protein
VIYTLQIEEGHVEDIADSSQLKHRLVQIHERAKAKPLFAIISAPDTSTLAIGLGRDLSVLSYSAPGGWPAKHVQGNVNNGGLIDYMYLNNFSEMPSEYAVPVTDAIDAVVEFIVSGSLSDKLQWKDD